MCVQCEKHFLFCVKIIALSWNRTHSVYVFVSKIVHLQRANFVSAHAHYQNGKLNGVSAIPPLIEVLEPFNSNSLLRCSERTGSLPETSHTPANTGCSKL